MNVAVTPVWRRYLELTKPKVVALIVFTAIVGTLLASPGLPPLDALAEHAVAHREPPVTSYRCQTIPSGVRGQVPT